MPPHVGALAQQLLISFMSSRHFFFSSLACCCIQRKRLLLSCNFFNSPWHTCTCTIHLHPITSWLARQWNWWTNLARSQNKLIALHCHVGHPFLLSFLFFFFWQWFLPPRPQRYHILFSTISTILVLPPSHNIRDFEFLLAMFDYSSYLKNFKIIIYFICDLLYYLPYFKHNFSFFIFAKKNWIRRVVKRYKAKTQNPLYYGTEGVAASGC
jgi:hypothetical protein